MYLAFSLLFFPKIHKKWKQKYKLRAEGFLCFVNLTCTNPNPEDRKIVADHRKKVKNPCFMFLVLKCLEVKRSQTYRRDIYEHEMCRLTLL